MRNASNQHFLLFSQCFLPFPKQISCFWSHSFFLSANDLNLDQSIILPFGKELTLCLPNKLKENLNLMVKRCYSKITPPPKKKKSFLIGQCISKIRQHFVQPIMISIVCKSSPSFTASEGLKDIQFVFLQVIVQATW